MKYLKSLLATIPILCIFFILYQPPLLSFSIIHVVGLISIVYLLILEWKSSSSILFNKNVIAVESLFIALLILILLEIIVLSHGSFNHIAFPVFYIVDIVPFCLAISNYARRNNWDRGKIIDIIIIVGSLQGLLIVLALFNQSIQEIFIGKLIEYGYTTEFSKFMLYRMYGFAASLAFVTPILQAFISVICFVRGVDSKNKIVYYILGILNLISGVINARTALIVFVLGVSLYTLSRTKIRTKIIFFSMIILLYFVSINIVIPFLNEEFPNTYNWIYGGIEEIDYALKGDVSSGYFSYITSSDKYVIPNNIDALIIGKGYRIMGGGAEYGVSSDVGFINDIWLGGILYLITVYSIFFMFMRKVYLSPDKRFSFIGLFFIFTFILVNFKGSIFNMNGLTNLLLLFYITDSSFNSSNNDQQREETLFN